MKFIKTIEGLLNKAEQKGGSGFKWSHESRLGNQRRAGREIRY